MSRILNRPMFRGGGKVSSYGNGIATGLADGGMADKRGLVDGPGGYSGKDDFIPIAPQAIKDARNMGTLMTPEYLNNKFRKNYYLDSGVGYRGTGMPITGMQGMIDIEDEFNLDGQPIIDEGSIMDITRNQILKGDKGGTAPQYEEFLKKQFIKDNYQSDIDRQQKALEAVGDKDSLVKLLGEVDTPEKSKQKTEAEIRAEIAQEFKDQLGSKKLTDEEALAGMEKEKALFEKMLGGGKSAMIEDASNMAINYAAGAFKEGATVKSSFADFFEKESKRPSRRMKVKDAATQAAIQSYLTGKTSYQKFQDQIGIAKAGIDMKTEALRPKNLNDAFDVIMKPGDKATDPGIMSRAVEKIYGVDSFIGELKPDVELIVGKVYYADAEDKSSNKILYLIDKNGEPQFLKTVYR